jgi:hypothetical protein
MERRPDVDPQLHALITNEIVPVVRVVLREATELRAAVQLLGERLDALTTELADGGLPELIRLASSALRTYDTHRNGGRRP